MTREAFEIELNKLDLLHQKYTEAYETLLAHVRSGELNFLEWDDKTYKAAEAAWHTQLKKVYPDQCEYEDCDQIQDRLETMAVEFTCEQEVPDEPDDLVEAFSAAEERWHQITDENRMKENLELIAREHFKEGTSTRFEGNYIVSIYRYGKMVIGFPADAYEIDSDIPLKEMIELRVKPTWSSCLRKETISTGNSVILVDAKTQEIVFQRNHHSVCTWPYFSVWIYLFEEAVAETKKQGTRRVGKHGDVKTLGSNENPTHREREMDQIGVRYGRKNSSAYGTHQKPTTNSRTHPDSIVYHLGRRAWCGPERHQDHKEKEGGNEVIQIMVKDGEISTREVTHVPEVDEETLRRSLGALKVPHFDPARRARYIANLVDQEERKKEEEQKPITDAINMVVWSIACVVFGMILGMVRL